LRGAQAVDTANKRLYVHYKASSWIVFYFDLSNGYASATASPLIKYEDPTGGKIEMTGRGSCVLTNGIRRAEGCGTSCATRSRTRC
jgi:hypothetical protein